MTAKEENRQIIIILILKKKAKQTTTATSGFLILSYWSHNGTTYYHVIITWGKNMYDNCILFLLSHTSKSHTPCILEMHRNTGVVVDFLQQTSHSPWPMFSANTVVFFFSIYLFFIWHLNRNLVSVKGPRGERGADGFPGKPGPKVLSPYRTQQNTLDMTEDTCSLWDSRLIFPHANTTFNVFFFSLLKGDDGPPGPRGPPGERVSSQLLVFFGLMFYVVG